MNIAIQVEPSENAPPAVDYRWDADTDILSAGIVPPVEGTGMSGVVELMGDDGAWLNIEVTAGRICGLEVAVWPDVRTVPGLRPSNGAETAHVLLPARRSQPGMASVEIDTAMTAEADPSRTTIHFTVGRSRPARTLCIASDLLLEIDERQRIAGIWFLNVPPFPHAK